MENAAISDTILENATPTRKTVFSVKNCKGGDHGLKWGSS